MSKPLCCAREIGKDEVCCNGDTDGNGSLDDEQPSPCSKTVKVIHTAGDTGCYETAECSGDERAGVENCGSETKFFACVPAGKVVETTGEVCSLYESVRSPIGSIGYNES